MAAKEDRIQNGKGINTKTGLWGSGTVNKRDKLTIKKGGRNRGTEPV
jgi:hypothetical protein